MDLKRILTYSTVLALILVVGAIGYQFFEGGSRGDIPYAPEDADVIGYWETEEGNTEHDITLDFKKDGTVEGTIEGIRFDGQWGQDDLYYIYNDDGAQRFSATVTDDELTLQSTSVTSTASRWTLYRKYTESTPNEEGL